MLENTGNVVTMEEAARDFSRVARLAGEKGPVVITDGDAPRYLILPFKEAETILPDEELFALSGSLMEQNRRVYEVLAR